MTYSSKLVLWQLPMLLTPDCWLLCCRQFGVAVGEECPGICYGMTLPGFEAAPSFTCLEDGSVEFKNVDSCLPLLPPGSSDRLPEHA